ncbi:hypothetical protein ACSC89_003449 [Salmonella enterica subsp. enterica]|nr:hypothetical protein [Salmonella enterica subsp. enterica serovar Vancouver]
MTALKITSMGMCCAVGYSTSAATAAIRAGMDHFRETDFVGPQGNPLLGAQLFEVEQWGTARIRRMFRQVLDECLSGDPLLIPEQTCLLLITPESERPGTDRYWQEEIYRICTEQQAFHTSSEILPMGKTGLVPALKLAQELLLRSGVHRVLIAGVDSFLTPAAITHYMDRLLCDENTEGFLPGEGAGAICVTLSDSHCDSIVITGLGQAYEEAHYLQEKLPNCSKGLTNAIRMALSDSGIDLSETHFHISANNGESYYARETTHAISRCLNCRVQNYPHILINAYLGETGAAAGPLILAYLAATLRHPDNQKVRALVHLSDDSGQRVAAIIECFSAKKKQVNTGVY